MSKSIAVWALILLIAFMVVGYVGTGFAQTEDDGLIVPISGAQGRSVRTDVLLGAWSWTAPATGLVTFDTQGTGFDTALTVSDSATYTLVAFATLNEVRFTAQQGQAYSITAIRAGDFSFAMKDSRDWHERLLQRGHVAGVGCGTNCGSTVRPVDFPDVARSRSV